MSTTDNDLSNIHDSNTIPELYSLPSCNASSLANRTPGRRIPWWILRCLAWWGCRIYGNFGPRAIRIGPQTILKWGSDVDLAEADAMHFVAQKTSVPVPEVFGAWKYGSVTVILMRYVEGESAWSSWNKLTGEQQTHLCSELEGYVRQLRSLPPPSPCQVSSTFGGVCRDHRFGTRTIGPFQDHETFHKFLRRDKDLTSYQSRHPDVVALHSANFVSKFTHGDLKLWNVIVLEGKIMAIIDWDSSGWRPEYWEYTKARYNPLGTPELWIESVRRATGQCDEHVKGEMCLWHSDEFPSSPIMYPKR